MWIQIVMDQCCGFKFYTLNLDPDPGFWPNLDSELDPGLNQQFTSKSFAYILSYNYMCASGSVLRYSEYVSGSRKLLNTDPIRIRIHNNGVDQDS